MTGKKVEDWDPMKEHFAKKNRYDNGPGADSEKNMPSQNVQTQKEFKIVLRKMPSGITKEGIRNLCLNSGKPLVVDILSSRNLGFVTFATHKEAELAIRDLNETPPYHMAVGFYTGKNNNSNNINNNNNYNYYFNNNKEKGRSQISGTPENAKQKQPERWDFDKTEFSECVKKTETTTDGKQKPEAKSSPYFPFHCELSNPSLTMRQKKLDFKTDKLCVSKGRGYINLGDEDLFKKNFGFYSLQSDDWVEYDNESYVKNCFSCGCLTYQKTKESSPLYCSFQCEADASSQANRLENSRSNIFDFFSVGKTGLVEFLESTKEPQKPSCVVLDEKMMDYKYLKKHLTHNPIINKPKPGDFVTIQLENNVFRGVIQAELNDRSRVCLLDYGKVKLMRHVHRMSDDLKKIINFRGTATLMFENCQLNSVKFVIKRKATFNVWICDAIDPTTGVVIGEIQLEQWFPPSKSTTVPIESGCSVVMTSYRNMKTVFVRRIDSPWHEKYVRFENDIAACALDARLYDATPKPGDLCLARYEGNGCYYRARIIQNTEDDILVYFVDHGNEQLTKSEDLRYLPQDAAIEPFYAIKIQLLEVTTLSSPETVRYFNKLVTNGTELILNISTLKRDPEYSLKEKATDIVVNDNVNSMLTPSWKNLTFTKSGDVHYLEEVEETLLPIGETTDIFVLHFDRKEFDLYHTFWVTSNRSDMLGHLNGELKERISQYCDFLKDDPYRPREGEVCLSMFEENWHRAVSLCEENNICQLLLIDRGILYWAPTTFVRKILEEFLEMPALAVECKISGCEKMNEKEKQKVRNFIDRENKNWIRGVKIVGRSMDVYELELPLEKANFLNKEFEKS